MMADSRPARVLVTGGAGFIGSALVLRLAGEGHLVTNVDKMTYAANPASLAALETAPNYRLVRADIRDSAAMTREIEAFRPDAIFHLAAESHVDRSIADPGDFITTNVVGTFTLLDAALQYWRSIDAAGQAAFRFVHVSTDEVFGTLGPTGSFDEASPYRPNSPYSASKASSDHLARVWHSNYGLPVIVTNCSNNYGPRQNREKFIPTCITRALRGEPIPIYGDGQNVRDWIYVEDHVDGLLAAARRGAAGQTYLFGGGPEAERANIDLARRITAHLDKRRPRKDGRSYAEQLSFVTDRTMHDFRYAIDSSATATALGWACRHAFEEGLAETIDWYLESESWWAAG